MAQAVRGADLDGDAACLVLKRLDPWSRGRCACINRTWNAAVREVSSYSNQHWLVAAHGNSSLWMCNVLTGYEKVVKPDLPWGSIPTLPAPTLLQDPYLARLAAGRQEKSMLWRVLCSFRGLVLVNLGSKHNHTLVLGDPLLNKWIRLPTPAWTRTLYLCVAAFCCATNTILVTTDGGCTATFDLATAEWLVDPPIPLGFEGVYNVCGHLCCMDGVFYGSFAFEFDGSDRRCIACYDPVDHRRWRVVHTFSCTDWFFPTFLAEHPSNDKMLLYMLPDDDGELDDFQLFEASRSTAASGGNELQIVRCPLMDDESIGKRMTLPLTNELPYQVFYGKGDMFFWEAFAGHRDKVLVLSLQHGILREVKSTRCNSNNITYPYSKCYFVAAPGTCELLQSLAAKLEQRPAGHKIRPASAKQH